MGAGSGLQRFTSNGHTTMECLRGIATARGKPATWRQSVV